MSRPSKHLRAVGGVLVAVALVLVPSPALARPTAATVANSAATSWQVAGRLSLGYARGISCPTASSCWAISGGELLSSTDGGASWAPQTARVPAGIDVLDALDCPSATTCYVTGRRTDLSIVVLAVTATEVTVSALPSPDLLRTISCAGTFRCLTTDGSIVYGTRDQGASWQQRRQHLTGIGIPALSCVRRTVRCTVVGGSIQAPRIEVTDNGGGSWQPQAAPYEYAPLVGVDCPTIEACYAVGQDSFQGTVIATSDGGTTWARQSLPSGTDPLSSISCPSPQTCWAAGGPGGAAFGAPEVIATTDAGAQWDAQVLGSFPVGASAGALVLSCPTTSACAGVTGAGLGFVTTSGGLTWTAVPIPAALGGVGRLSCPSRQRCVGMGSDALLRRVALTSADGGNSWSRHALPSGTGYVTSLDCPSVSACYATAFVQIPNTQRLAGQVLSSTDGGATWRLDHGADVKPLGVGRVSCSTVTTCLAVGADRSGPTVRVTTDGAASWAPVPPPAGVSGLRDVACGSSCVLLARPAASYYATLAFTTTDLGATFQPSDLPASDFGYSALDCFGASCVAVGSSTDYHGVIAGSGDGGLTWAAQRVPAAATRLQDVSCGSATACAVTGNNAGGSVIVGTRSSGQRWTVFPIPNSASSSPLDVACAGLSCVASDYGVFGTARILRGPA